MANESLRRFTCVAAGAFALAFAQISPAGAQQEQPRQPERVGYWCEQDLAEVELDAQSQPSGPVIAGAAGGNEKQQKQAGPNQKDLEHLKRAARILHKYGRNDACRMVVFEMRQILSFDGTKGTNSP